MAVGPLELHDIEVLWDRRVIDATTPISTNGDDFNNLGAFAELYSHLEDIKVRLNEGEEVWSAPSAPASGASETADLLAAGAETVIRAWLVAARDQVSGRLTAARDEGDIRVDLREGAVAAVATDDPELDLGAFLVSSGRVDQATLDTALGEAPNFGGDLSAALIARGHVQPHEFFESYLGWAEKCLGAADAATTAESVDQEVPAPAFPLGLPRYGVVMAALRKGLKRSELEAKLSPKRSGVLVPAQLEGVSIDDCKLKPRELRCVNSMNGTRSLSTLLEELGGNEEKTLAVLRAAFFAVEAGFVVLGEDPELKKERRQARQLQSQLQRWEELNFFEILEVTETSSDDDTRNRYTELAKQLHPDNLRADCAPELREVHEKLFGQVVEAFEALETEAQRYKYGHDLEHGLLGGKDDLQKVQDTLRAETLFKKAEVLTRVKKYEEAIAHLDEALELNPEDTEFKVLRAYLQYLQGCRQGLDPAETASKTAKEIQQHLVENPDIASAYLFLGHLSNAMNKPDSALKYFQRVLEYQERHPEASSQVRLLRMRKEKNTKKKKWF